MSQERIEALVFRQHGAMDLWRYLKHSTEMTCNVKIEGIAAITLNFFPFDPWAKVLSGCYQLNWNSLLARTNEDDDVRVVVQARKIHLLHVLKINEQKFLSQLCLAL